MGGSYPYVSALTAYNGKLVAGGYFTAAGGMACSGIASWDGSSWEPLGNGVGGGSYGSSPVSALTVYNGQLVAGGSFTTAGGVACNYVASWNGSSWQPLGSGMGGTSPEVASLIVYNGQLVAGGYFTAAGGVACSCIASWDGSSWQPLGSGMNEGVGALIAYNGQLVAGGGFTTAGGLVSAGWARWGLTGDIDGDGVVDMSDLLILAAAFGSVPGDTNWNPACDLGSYGVVNTQDLLMLAANWGAQVD
jgi:hypothetical protein